MKVQKEKITQTEEISKKLSGFKTELTPNDLIEIEKINEEILTCDQKVKQFLVLRYPEKVRPFAFKIEQLFLQRGLLEQKNFKEREALKAKIEGLTGPVISAFKIEFAVEADRIKKLRDYKITNKTYNGKKDGYTYEILSNFSGIDKAMMRLSEGRVKLQGMTFRPLSEIIKLHDDVIESIDESYPLSDTAEGGEDVLTTFREMRAGDIAEVVYGFKSPAFLMSKGGNKKWNLSNEKNFLEKNEML